MLETGLAQLRFAASMLFSLPLSAWTLVRLVDVALDTRREFGAIGPEAAEFLSGSPLDEEARRDMQLRRFWAQAAARDTPYYAIPLDARPADEEDFRT